MNLRFQDALTARRKQLAEGEGQKGFTLIELLVVVIIIGILAAIAIPVFLNLREGAWRSSVESDLKNAALAIEAYTIENNGSLVGMDTTTLTSAGGNTDLPGARASDGNSVTITLTGTPATGYVLEGTNSNLPTTTTLEYDSADGGLGTWSDR